MFLSSYYSAPQLIGQWPKCIVLGNIHHHIALEDTLLHWLDQWILRCHSQRKPWQILTRQTDWSRRKWRVPHKIRWYNIARLLSHGSCYRYWSIVIALMQSEGKCYAAWSKRPLLPQPGWPQPKVCVEQWDLHSDRKKRSMCNCFEIISNKIVGIVRIRACAHATLHSPTAKSFASGWALPNIQAKETAMIVIKTPKKASSFLIP